MGGHSVILILSRKTKTVQFITAIQQVAGTEITMRVCEGEDQCGTPQELEGIGSKSQGLWRCKRSGEGVSSVSAMGGGIEDLKSRTEGEVMANVGCARSGYHPLVC